MAVRRMLALLTGTEADAPLLRDAFAVASRHGARLDALFVRRSARSGADFLGDAFSVYGMESLLEDLETAGSQAAMAAKSAFETAAGAAKEKAVGGFTDFIGLPAEALSAHGRLCDVVVMAKPGADGDRAREDAARAALLETGRPVLLLPDAGAEPASGRFARVTAAWDGSQEAARALIGALDFLADAEDVDVVTVTDEGAASELGGAAERYLDLHGVKADLREEDREGRPMGVALAEIANESKADLLVMGGFGTSAWREQVGGGATRRAMRHAACALLVTH
jgi:nucleotide-binding universal stress UspA family protein